MRPATVYSAFSAFNAAAHFFMAATYVPFLLTTVGLTLAEVAWINVAFWAVIILAEIPTSILADGHSRQWSLRIGLVFHLAGFASYAMAQDFTSALVSEVLIGLGASFLSGVQQAWVTDALHRQGDGHRLRQVLSGATVIQGVVGTGAAVLGSFLADLWGLRVPYVLAVVTLAAALLFVWRFMHRDGEPNERLDEREILRQSWRAARTLPALRWSLAVTLVFGFVVVFNHNWPSFFEARGASIAMLGWIFVPIYLAVAFGGFLAHRLPVTPRGETTALVAAGMGAGLMMASVGLLPGMLLPIGASFLHNISRSAFRPLLESYTQRHIQSAWRATYGSLQSMVERAGTGLALVAAGLFLHGKAATDTVVTELWVAVGAGMSVTLLLLFLWRPR